MINFDDSVKATILGIGTARPDCRIHQDDAAKIAIDLGISNRWTRAIPQLYRASGVEHRGSVLLHTADGPPIDRQRFFRVADDEPLGPGTKKRMDAFEEFAPKLALQASVRALDVANLRGVDITHLITVSCSGFAAPGVDFVLMRELDLPRSVLRTNVGFMGCHAAINAIRIANSIAVADPHAKVLLCAVELCSLHQQYSDDPQQLVANSLFADGAAAVIVGTTTGVSDEVLANAIAWTVVDSSSTWLPDTVDMMSWKIGDNGFQMSLSPKVPTIIEEQLFVWMTDWLQKQSLSVDSIDRWIIHPGGPKILDACGNSLGLAPEALTASRSCLRDNGNMSSPTVLFILESGGKPHTGELAVMLGFGPGLAIEAALLQGI